MNQEILGDQKPLLTIGIIGPDSHGKTTLTKAISRILSAQPGRLFSSEEEMHSWQQSHSSFPSNDRLIEYETQKRHYAHIDLAGHVDYVKDMITGAVQMDGAILVVSAADRWYWRTREHILRARQAGVPAIVVFLNKTDLVEDAELLDLIALDIRNLLSLHGYPGGDIPIVKGSALKALNGNAEQRANILQLMDAVDDYIPLPKHLTDQPFLMSIEDVFAVEGRGTVCTGRIERGIIRKMDAVEIVGIRETIKTTVSEIEMSRSLREEARAGDDVGLLLRGVKKTDIERGQVVAGPGSVKSHRKFVAQVYMLSKSEGGRHTPFFKDYRPQFSFWTTNVTGFVTIPDAVEMVMPSDNVSITVKLITPLAMEVGTRFSIREGGKMVGAGRVTKVLDDTGLIPQLINFSDVRRDMIGDSSFFKGISTQINASMADFELPVLPKEKRFLQAALRLKKKRASAPNKPETLLPHFHAGQMHSIKIHIGPVETHIPLIRHSLPFPDDKLPPGLNTLTIDFVPLVSDAEALRDYVTLPETGPSDKAEFDFLVPSEATAYEARIIVSRENRILQTAKLYGSTDKFIVEGSEAPLISLLPEIMAREALSPLQDETRFAASFIMNHNSRHEQLLTLVKQGGATVSGGNDIQGVVEEMDRLLDKYVFLTSDDWQPPQAITKHELRLLRSLTRAGSSLHVLLEEKLNRKSILRGQPIQLFTKNERRLPLEFVYEAEANPNHNAKLCKKWRHCLQSDTLCEASGDTAVYCPSRFWGVSRVIERHHYDEDISEQIKGEFLVASPSEDQRNLPLMKQALMGASVRVGNLWPDDKHGLSSLQAAMVAAGGQAEIVPDWKSWRGQVIQKPDCLLMIVHTEKAGDVRFIYKMEIAKDMSLESGQITKKEIGGDVEHHPLVMVLGCHTSPGTIPFAEIVSRVRRASASVIIGSGSYLHARQIVPFSELFIQGLDKALDAKPAKTFGQFMRQLRIECLLKHQLTVLALTAYGDADWILTRRK